MIRKDRQPEAAAISLVRANPAGGLPRRHRVCLRQAPATWGALST